VSAQLVEDSFCDLRTREEWPKVSAEGTAYHPSPTRHVRGSQADFDNARRQFPVRDVDEWVDLFDRAPHVLHQLLGDIYRETKAEAQREAGKARIGRRPKAIDGNLDELHAMITPQYSMDPFAVAVQPLIKKCPSLRAFAAKVPMNHHTLTRMMRGDVALERWRLEAIAKAGKVQPGYFKEYREQLIVEAITALLTARPNVSVRVHKQLQQEARR
jgi:hypothetical protein